MKKKEKKSSTSTLKDSSPCLSLPRSLTISLLRRRRKTTKRRRWCRFREKMQKRVKEQGAWRKPKKKESEDDKAS